MANSESQRDYETEAGLGPHHRDDRRFRLQGKSALVTAAVQSYGWVMLDWSQCPGVERIAGKVSGAWLFQGTRVPVAALFENLEDGATVDDFLDWFPGVARKQVEAVLEHAEQSLLAA